VVPGEQQAGRRVGEDDVTPGVARCRDRLEGTGAEVVDLAGGDPLVRLLYPSSGDGGRMPACAICSISARAPALASRSAWGDVAMASLPSSRSSECFSSAPSATFIPKILRRPIACV